MHMYFRSTQLKGSGICSLLYKGSMTFVNFHKQFCMILKKIRPKTIQAFILINSYLSLSANDKILKDAELLVPIAGNTWAYHNTNGLNVITNAGIENWTNSMTRFETYLRTDHVGTLKVRIKARTDGETRLRISINGDSRTVSIKGSKFQLYNAGEWNISDTGYIRITLSGVSKTGKRLADVSDYAISGSITSHQVNFVRSNEGNFFYWGRRGPSVHLSYPFDDSIKAQWFYNEVTIPEGQDVIGSYFMSIGFGEGYFGIQVNSETERRVLFSVWSPYHTDDPKSIPQNMRITMLRKGQNVQTGEFGNEGSGGQSYLRYNWKAGNTYKFILKGDPDNNNNTVYTAWFFAPEQNKWMLIASFRRPQTNTYLKRFHSFLENFIPDQGDIERKVLFGNQWIGGADGNWMELTKSIFTYDNTAAKGYRMDFEGGVLNERFYLKNCGFFNQYTPYRSGFMRAKRNARPLINLGDLP